MEFLGVRQPFTHFQEEKYQMLELNQRLESYLGRVKLLEEENKLLKEEIYTLKKSAEPPGQRKAQEEALIKTRKMKEEVWREKDRVEMEVENLIEDIQMVNIQRQKEKTAHAEAQKRLADSKKELEEERRAQNWLREKFAQLENDLVLQMQVHQENMETLQASLKQTKQVLMAPQIIQTNIIPDLGQEYGHRAAQAWKEATSKYQRKVENLEESLNQAKTNMGKLHQEKREKQYQIQQLAKELESMRMKREMLEKHAVQQRDEHSEELQHLQAQVDALEMEKETLGQEIGSLMVDRQNLLQVKMSLGLELATYRALLESEGMRINKPATNKTQSTIHLDALSKPTGTHPPSKTSSQFSSIVSTSHRSIGSSQKLLTNVTPTWTPTRGSPQKKPSSTSGTDKKMVNLSEEKGAQESVNNFHPKKDLQDMTRTATPPQTMADSVTEEPEDLKVESEPKCTEMVESKTNESVLMSVLSTDLTSSLSQTPETESWAGPFTEPAGVSEESKDEDTEVSVEMALISHAPKVAWEENKTMGDDKEDASEMDVRSETISESHIIGNAESDNPLTFSHVSKNTNIMVSSIQEPASLYTVDGFGYKEETNEDLMRGDEKDNVSNISEDLSEPMNSETEAPIDSIIEWNREEDNEEQNRIKVKGPDSEVEEKNEIKVISSDFDVEEQNEIKVMSSDFEVEEQNETKVTNPDFEVEEQNDIKVMSSDFDVKEENEIKVMSSDFEVEDQNETKVTSPDFEVEEQNEIIAMSSGFKVEEQNEIKVTTPDFEVEEHNATKEVTIPDYEVEEQNDIKLMSSDFEVEEQNETKVTSADFEVEEQNEIKEVTSLDYEVEEQNEIKVMSSDFKVEEQNEIKVTSPDLEVDEQNETKIKSPDFEVDEQNETKIKSPDFEVEEQNEIDVTRPDFEVDEQNETKVKSPDFEVEEQNEIEVTSPDFDVEEQNEMKIMRPDVEAEKWGEVEIENEIKDTIVTKENEEPVIMKDVDGGLQTVDSQKNLDHVGSTIDIIEETVAHTKEYRGEDQEDDEDSQNISVSCTTDPGDCDSYTQENTIADTRPLIRYKSDDETDINVQAAHFEGAEMSDSEDEKERIDGGRCGESVSKRFNTMEDLSEEPDMDVIGEMITEETIQTEEALEDEDLVVEGESVTANLMGNQKVDSDDDVRDEDHGFNVFEQKEIPQLNEEPLIHHTEQPVQKDDETVNSNDSQENDLKFVNNQSSFPDPQFPETSQEVQLQDSNEVSSAFSQSTTITKQTFLEDVQNMSMHTNMDFMETLPLESEINSQPDLPNFDQDECNSSDDESPNASQSFQYSSLSPKATANEQPLTLAAQLTNDKVSEADLVFNNEPEVFSKDFIEKSTEDHKTSQIHDWDNSNICKSTATTADITFNMDESSSQHSMKHETENLDSPNRMASVAENIFGVFEKNTTESFSTQESNVIDIFQRDIPEEEFPSKEKESEIHSFFSTNLKEDFWNEGKMEMGATNDPVKTETFTHESIHLNQGMVFGEEWRDLGVMPTANGNSKEEMKIFKVQTQDEKLRHKAEESRQAEMIQSDESVDGGDSWSSGDE